MKKVARFSREKFRFFIFLIYSVSVFKSGDIFLFQGQILAEILAEILAVILAEILAEIPAENLAKIRKKKFILRHLFLCTLFCLQIHKILRCV